MFNSMSPAKAKAIFDFQGLRKRLGFNQPEMASKMHMSPRTYFSLETEPNAMNQRHIMLAQLVSLQEAVAQGDASLAEKGIADLCDKFQKIGRKTRKNF